MLFPPQPQAQAVDTPQALPVLPSPAQPCLPNQEWSSAPHPRLDPCQGCSVSALPSISFHPPSSHPSCQVNTGNSEAEACVSCGLIRKLVKARLVRVWFRDLGLDRWLASHCFLKEAQGKFTRRFYFSLQSNRTLCSCQCRYSRAPFKALCKQK